MPSTLHALLLWAIVNACCGVSTKVDFETEDDSVTKSSLKEEEDVEVKHTIVVSTKLKNRGGIHSSGDGDAGILTYKVGNTKFAREDSGEVPIVIGSKAIETTRIRTPDTRRKPNIYPDAVFVSRNIRDEFDNVYLNVATNPSQWRPSSFFKNINYWSPEPKDSFGRRVDRPHQNPVKIDKKLKSDNSLKEFYCKRCRELSFGQDRCSQRPSYNYNHGNQWDKPWTSTTTPKMKIDGKLAKLN